MVLLGVQIISEITFEPVTDNGSAKPVDGTKLERIILDSGYLPSPSLLVENVVVSDPINDQIENKSESATPGTARFTAGDSYSQIETFKKGNLRNNKTFRNKNLKEIETNADEKRKKKSYYMRNRNRILKRYHLKMETETEKERELRIKRQREYNRKYRKKQLKKMFKDQ